MTISLDKLEQMADEKDMRQNAVNPDGIEGHKIRRKLLLRYLPLHEFKVYPAAVQAGYAPSYARSRLLQILKKDEWYCAQVLRLKEENLAIAVDKVVSLDKRVENTLDRQDLSVNELCKLAELYYRRKGALADKTIIETAERERELSQAARKAAKKLAIHLMKPSETPTKAG